jgi:hypothetical protein
MSEDVVARPWAGFPVAAVVAVVTTLVIAGPYWAQSYDAVKDDGIFTSFWLVEALVLLGTAIACTVVSGRVEVVLTTMAMMCCAAPIAVLGRVVIDTAADPTSHNLWPLEVALTVFATAPVVAVGALVAWPLRRLLSRPPA